MLGETAMSTSQKRGIWMAVIILAITALWLIAIATRTIPFFTKRLSAALSPEVASVIVFAMPLFLAAARLRMRLPNVIRAISFLLLIVGAILLPVEIKSRPAPALILVAGIYFEEFLLIPRINKSWERVADT
jgi:hypothetical protein